MTRVIFEFPNEESAKSFLVWLCDCGGEDRFLSAETEECLADNGEDRKPIESFDYARAFPGWGYNPKIHGPDRVVTAKEAP